MKKFNYISGLLLSFAALPFHMTQAQTCIDNAPEIHAEGSLIDRNDGTVLDINTGLLWSKCNVGEVYEKTDNSCSGQPSNFSTWQDALLAVNDPTVSTVGELEGFRIPNIKELQSIVDYRCISPAINNAVFISTMNAAYWSNTPDIHNVNSISGYDGLLIDFKDGQEIDTGASGLLLLRLVKNIVE
ncbi:hypothetical protein UA32_12300 [Photobacterium angustum]|uniref:DUF1566 domain-containing protein n=2 Tax=Photobacterium angustum TaxID=661 RepID=A0ABX5GZ10_PHOAN|nr:hypothetical protein UA32_12300 [Photobacterium angustum]PSX03933.1 DUF1566 domain-containing protein [Photobacterium angustum]